MSGKREESKMEKRKARGEKGERRSTPFKSLVKTERLRAMVVMPEGGDINHWLATHCCDFVNLTNVIFGSITEFCTEASCPVMSCGKQYEYLWKDKNNPQYRKAVKVPAAQYVELLMKWIELQTNNEQIFPTDEGGNYPEDFRSVVVNIFKRLFRVYAHIYHSHFLRIQQLNEGAHLNTVFKHFVFFVLEYDLVNPLEMKPLESLIISLIGEEYWRARGPPQHQDPTQPPQQQQQQQPHPTAPQ